MFIGPCIIVIVEEKKTNLMTLAILFHFLGAQHVSDINTQWRKRKHFFSNNGNFLNFQYKKIMLTPKQPVINSVLITYIDYSITENYIGKMASFLPCTRPEPLLKVLHHIY